MMANEGKALFLACTGEHVVLFFESQAGGYYASLNTI